MARNRDEFVDFAIKAGALCFGEFTLKSGRISPYFFNIGAFNNGAKLFELGKFYARTIVEKCPDFDLLFGPAYKGIPLVSAAAIALAADFDKNAPYGFNRKEAKNYGEGGDIIGVRPSGKVLIIDDVITKGLALGESVEIIRRYGGQIAGVVVALDRQEKGGGGQSAAAEVSQRFGISVFSIINLSDLDDYLRRSADEKTAKKIASYRAKYGV